MDGGFSLTHSTREHVLGGKYRTLNECTDKRIINLRYLEKENLKDDGRKKIIKNLIKIEI